MEFLNNNMFAELPEEDIGVLESFLEEEPEVFYEDTEVEEDVDHGY